LAHRDRKTQSRRGSVTYGYGSRKKHRGKGSRGGVGMAGSKKHKWSRVSKTMPDYFKHKGFTTAKSVSRKIKALNIGRLQERLDDFVAEGVASKQGKSFNVDLTKTEYSKLIGAGRVSVKLNVKVDSCSRKAREKVEAAGGRVETPTPVEEK
jgi:large subunit ribosomal protein L15